MNDNETKKPGTTYNIKLKTDQLAENGKPIWKAIGKVFIRADGSGGAVYVGDGDTQKTFALFPATPRSPRQPVAQPSLKAAETAWG